MRTWGWSPTHLCLMTWMKSLLFNCKYRSVIASERHSTTSRQRVFIMPWNFGSRKNTVFINLSRGHGQWVRGQSHSPPDTRRLPPASYLSAKGGKFFTTLFKHTINLSSIVFWCCFNCFTISSHMDSSRIWKIKFLFQYTKVDTYVKFLRTGLPWLVKCLVLSSPTSLAMGSPRSNDRFALTAEHHRGSGTMSLEKPGCGYTCLCC